MLHLIQFKWKKSLHCPLNGLGLHCILFIFSLYFHSHLLGLTSQATSDFQLMKAVAEETRLSPLGRQQRLARLADDIQRYWDTSLGPECTLLQGLVYTIGRCIKSSIPWWNVSFLLIQSKALLNCVVQSQRFIQEASGWVGWEPGWQRYHPASARQLSFHAFSTSKLLDKILNEEKGYNLKYKKTVTPGTQYSGSGMFKSE